eukprot:scaffold71416_cov81-Cyclotella_meneghiniana.AAC.2
MGVKGFWKQSLGKFRDQESKKLVALPHKCVATDTSEWMYTHKMGFGKFVMLELRSRSILIQQLLPHFRPVQEP